ncbi:polysaccharide pyruvyl transferase family protein [Pseudoroseomonas ludipueritiae]|uniref:Polysaccharide pyruvyl transferase family protein n=1 Tax=Pseudoroseomonas ludipueritiae TaxID=198093 RepID=A0ABR7RCD8_9PROT|nr:polysaccharide pyruvyl transferase family protein [Pseudoroseomonas ludipueritiae]MBC9179416.1 polysaccharide pyruvyl transferase family protein [Pseudoroseomonas ludipueritiae]
MADYLWDQYTSFEDKYRKIGKNTGNLLFKNALRSIIQADHLYQSKLDQYDCFVTTDLIWIPENFKPPELLKKILAMPGDKKVVPISVGLQAPKFKTDFVMSEDTVKLLRDISERATLAIRGNYTAEVLHRKGITNLEVVGCPSVYQLPLYSQSLDGLRKKAETKYVVANYKSIHGTMRQVDVDILGYFARTCSGFVEQTEGVLGNTNVDDPKLLEWFRMHSNLFFDMDQWARYAKRYDFSIGARFHGNVLPVLLGIKSMFITCDSRTQEMVDFFEFPFVKIEDFDKNTPMEEFERMADYGKFTANYQAKLGRFTNFLEKNGLEMREPFKQKLASFAF